MIYKTCNYPGCSELVPQGVSYCNVHANREIFCKFPGCPIKVKGNIGYCDKHKPQRLYDKKRKKKYGNVYDWRWQCLALTFLKMQPLCEYCWANGNISPAALVHHIEPIMSGGAKYDTNNLMALCTGCHADLHVLYKKDKIRYNEIIEYIKICTGKNKNKKTGGVKTF